MLDMQIKTALTTIQQYLRQLAEQETELIIYRHNCEKLERAHKRLDHLQTSSEIVSNSLLKADILWLLMQLDILKIKQRNNCDKLRQYRNDKQQCLKRMVIL